MKIEFDDVQIKIILESLGTCHAVEFMKGANNDHLSRVIVIMGRQLEDAGKLELFESVFNKVSND